MKEQTTEAIMVQKARLMAEEILVIYRRDSRTAAGLDDEIHMPVFRACFAHVAHKHNVFHRKSPEDRVRYNEYFKRTRKIVSDRLKATGVAKPTHRPPPKQEPEQMEILFVGVPDFVRKYSAKIRMENTPQRR